MMRYTCIISFLLATWVLNGQSINTSFGKNRVQYHDDFKNWWQYESTNFVTYWYGKARNIAQPTILTAEMDHDEIQQALEHRINDKIEIIVYLDITDLKQSNIGTEETFISHTGETKIVGNKMFVYYDGNHLNLRQKIREGIANVYFNNMLFGSNIQEIIQNALLLNLPEWYKSGIVAYAAAPWNAESESELRDLWNKFPEDKRFDKLAAEYPKITGHAFWFFIEQQYGKSAITNLLYLTKISRSMNNSFQYILNAEIETLEYEWINFYNAYFNGEKDLFSNNPGDKAVVLADKTIKKGVPISQIALSPNGHALAYVVNDLGKYKIIVKDLNSEKEQTIFKYGYKNIFQETDFNYPLIAWHPTRPELTYIYEHKDVIYLVRHNLNSGEEISQIIPEELQRIYSLDYIDDTDYLFSASTDGWSDLYRYLSKRRNLIRITEDFYDNLDARYVQWNGQKGILFSSNRQTDSISTIKFDTILPLNTFDIYFLPDEAKKAVRLTDTPFSNERQPGIIGNQVICTGDQSGIINTYIIQGQNQQPQALSNRDRSILQHSFQAQGDRYIRSFSKDGIHHIYIENLDVTHTVKPTVTLANRVFNTAIIPINKPEETEQKNTVAEIKEAYKFQSKFEDPPHLEPLRVRQPEKSESSNFSIQMKRGRQLTTSPEKYNNVRAIAANNKFALTDITTKLDNELLFEGLESYTGDRQQLLTTPMGLLLKANMKDIFEDHDLEAGVRIPTSFNGTEFFIVYDNKKGRIDKKYALYRKSTTYNNDIPIAGNLLSRSRKTSLLGLYQLKYPFDIYRSVRATSTLRLDNYLRLSTERTSFDAGAVQEKRLSLKLEYVYDNTYDAAINIKNGTRYKFYTEIINSFDFKLIDGFKINPSNGFTTVVGFDARHYIPILSKSILALRMAGATSFGSQKMLYYLGGMENWLFPPFNDQTLVPDHTDYAYKANVFQMRGFNNNIRNGA
ncbi:MAG: hypothetical protein LC107_06930, partial [Chitinophagales bacterium]|nr:hypothetical protein [Chitinophagales bacterium]